MLDPKEALGKVTKKKRVSAANSRKKKPQPGKQNKTSAKMGAQNVESDLLDDDDDDVGGNNDGGDDDDDDGNKIVGKPKVDNDKDDTSYHLDSESEHSMPPDSDIETEEAVVETKPSSQRAMRHVRC